MHLRIYWHTVGDYYTVFSFNSFVRDSFREVYRQENGVHLPSYWVEGRFQ